MSDTSQTRDRASVIYECLSRSRRRYILYRLDAADQPVALPELAEAVADWEVDARAEVDDEFVKEVYMSLYHTHVPKLADAGLVEYDQERDEVTLIEYPEELESIQRSRALLMN